MTTPLPHHTRARSNTASGPHSLSLKVLRLSRPVFATQTPLPHTPFGDGLDVPRNASLASPGVGGDGEGGERLGGTFPLTPLLTLPAAFGAAYVGEMFTCTLCVNCEEGSSAQVADEGSKRRKVTHVKILAELQSPSQQQDGGVDLPLQGGNEQDAIAPGETMQRTLRHELKDVGPHVLAVTVSYTETTAGGDAEGSERARTFRKLYQFVSQQLLAVRSKVTERTRPPSSLASHLREWILEGQLENVGEVSIVLEKVWLNTREGLKCRALNVGYGVEKNEATVLKPQDVEQVMFLVRDKEAVVVVEEDEEEEEEEEMREGRTGRVELGQLNIDWRSAMGEKGSLTTGWLATRV